PAQSVLAVLVVCYLAAGAEAGVEGAVVVEPGKGEVGCPVLVGGPADNDLAGHGVVGHRRGKLIAPEIDEDLAAVAEGYVKAAVGEETHHDDIKVGAVAG